MVRLAHPFLPQRMPSYEVSEQYFFRETGEKKFPGETVDLTEEQAAAHNRNHPGLLRPVRLTTQAAPRVVRARPASARRAPPTRKVAARRRK